MSDRKLKVEVCELADYVAHDSFWSVYIDKACRAVDPIGLHLAVFAEPFLSFVLDGRKTIESRFGRTRCAPFDQVRPGDIIMMKSIGGPVCALALTKQAWFFELHHTPIAGVREEYGDPICADDSFWEDRRDASYATLIELAEPTPIEAFPVLKRDRRGWVLLTPAQLTLDF